ncbi:hypothetical protein [Kibdelosporangium aridum]|uniref:hypothetical protein n=1 Tax=Kibdelosporangium aridum TaxID=2030 RepID=UPI0035EF70A7
MLVADHAAGLGTLHSGVSGSQNNDGLLFIALCCEPHGVIVCLHSKRLVSVVFGQ